MSLFEKYEILMFSGSVIAFGMAAFDLSYKGLFNWRLFLFLFGTVSVFCILSFIIID